MKGFFKLLRAEGLGAKWSVVLVAGLVLGTLVPMRTGGSVACLLTGIHVFALVQAVNRPGRWMSLPVTRLWVLGWPWVELLVLTVLAVLVVQPLDWLLRPDGQYRGWLGRLVTGPVLDVDWWFYPVLVALAGAPALALAQRWGLAGFWAYYGLFLGVFTGFATWILAGAAQPAALQAQADLVGGALVGVLVLGAGAALGSSLALVRTQEFP